ncbi:MAG: hypothetical protein HBSIN02_25310 [Bacteroidia bacterium]|nr:MAG: hypothetical protein HBSIN02_25310 [Bacteroidia bacterium]
MAYTYNKGSFDDLLDQFETTKKWLEQHGVVISDSRVQKYYQDVRLLVEAVQLGTTAEVASRERFLPMLNSVHEVQQFNLIWQGLNSCPKTKHFTARLKKVLQGSLMPGDERPEDSSHLGRDFGFELSIASIFKRAHYNWDPTSISDVFLSDGPLRIRIECKRPTSRFSVDSSVQKGMRQLKKTLRPSLNLDATYGLLAISVDKAVIPKDKIVLEAADLPSVSKLLDADLYQFTNDYRASWEGRSSRRIIGIILFIQAVSIIKSRNAPASVMYLHLVPLVTPSKLAYTVFEDIDRRISAVINNSGAGLTGR